MIPDIQTGQLRQKNVPYIYRSANCYRMDNSIIESERGYRVGVVLYTFMYNKKTLNIVPIFV